MADLYEMARLRRKHAQDQQMQDLLGPMEHEQFMQEVTQRSPAAGTLLMAGVPMYTLLKMMGMPVGGTGEMLTSRPSVDEIFRAWDGYRAGLAGLAGPR